MGSYRPGGAMRFAYCALRAATTPTDLILRSARRARLEGWPRARLWPVLRDARARKSALADLRINRCRSRVNPRSVRGFLRTRHPGAASGALRPARCFGTGPICYNAGMTRDQVKKILDRVLSWPPERQADVAHMVELMEEQDQTTLRLTDEQVAELKRRLADPSPKFVTLDEVRERFARRRA